MAESISCREPIEFAAGDTLEFRRSLPDFRASQGWSLKYELRGQTQGIEFTSTADGDSHSVTVAAGVTATWLAGEYVLGGYAVNAGTGERHQIYYGTLELLPNLPATAGNEDRRTFAQQMVDKYEALLLVIAEDNISSTEVGRENKFTFEQQRSIRDEHGYWVCVRRNEIKKERAKAGLPTGNRIGMVVNVIGGGGGFGGFGFGGGVRNF